VKRIALLGATGSIGRQALEIIAEHPELELVAAASGSQSVEALAPLTQVGGDLTELLERAEPDVVLNAVVGFAGLPATLWSLEAGIDLALANKESLVAWTRSTRRPSNVLKGGASGRSTRSCSPPLEARSAAGPATSSPR
jgi:1-deoxy-D-xylulose 5-phosphate reductoisomerase